MSIYEPTVRDMFESFKKLLDEGKGHVKVFTCRGSSGETGVANTPHLSMNDEGDYDAGPLCEECINEEVCIISVD